MSRAVLSIGSNLGDRLARLRSVVDGLGSTVAAVSPVYETDPWGGTRAGFEAQGEINRKDFGLSFDAAAPGGNALVSDKIKFNLDLEFAKA